MDGSIWMYFKLLKTQSVVHTDALFVVLTVHLIDKTQMFNVIKYIIWQ